MYKYLKLILDYISYFLANINFYLFIKKLKSDKINKDTNFFLFDEGGYGILCMATKCLKILNKKNKWKLIVAYNPSRHNRELSKIQNNIHFIQIGFKFNKYTENLRLKKKIINNFKKKIEKISYKNVFFYSEFLKEKFNTPPDENFTNEKSGNYGSFKDILKLINNEKNNLITKKINLNLGQDENKIKVAIKIRNKGKKFKEVGGILRDSSDLNHYKSIIEKISKENFQVFIGGDFDSLNCPEWFKQNKNIILKNKNVKNDIYNLYLDTNCEIIVGPMSGATNFNVFTKKNQLIVDSYPIGFTWLNSTMSFRIVEKGLNSIEAIISNSNWPIENDLMTRNLTSNELEKVIYDFVINFDKSKVYGIDPKEIGVDKSHFNFSNAKLSPIWIDIQNRYLKQQNN